MSALHEIASEMGRQDEKWGPQNHDDAKWLAILAEEFGEIARGMLEGDPANVATEIVQTAAVCAQWFNTIQRRKTGLTT